MFLGTFPIKKAGIKMRRTTLIVLLLWLTGVLPAYSATRFTIQFTNTNGSLTPTGSFYYDPTVTDSFSQFLVLWNGVTFDLTAQANNGYILDFGLGITTPPCLGNKLGAAAAFQLLTACAAAGGMWGAGEATAIGPSNFMIYLVDPAVGGTAPFWSSITGLSTQPTITETGAGGVYRVQATAPEPVYISDSQNNRVRRVDTSGIITTVAGNGTGGFSGDGGPAAMAELHNPYGIAVDNSGVLYIADTLNNRIRKVVNGTITTVAGNGAPSYSGDGGLATGAGLNNPTGVAVDNLGNLYIADQRNNRIRMVQSSGIITTFAGNGTVGNFGDGGPATGAELYYPTGIAVSGSNLYIADTDNQRVRTVSSGTISTLIGSGSVGYNCNTGRATSVGLHSPTGVAVEATGIFVADYANQCIREDTAGIVSTVAGNGIGSYGGDGGPGTSAELNNPTGVALDSSGNLYIADSVNNRIRQIDSAGIITTIAGDGAAGYNGDSGPAGSAQLYLPTGVAVAPPTACIESAAEGAIRNRSGFSAGVKPRALCVN
jgi:sugar lactone lactonase YvrE